MTSSDKRLEDLIQNQRDARFEFVDHILRRHGYERIRQKGSHCVYGKDFSPYIMIVVHNNQVKKRYVKDMLKALGYL